MAKQSMSDRIYEHYLAFGTSKKKASDKISRQEFYKRYGNTALKRKTKKLKRTWRTRRTRGVLRDIGTGLTAAEKRRMTD